jgi:hypothetical protein
MSLHILTDEPLAVAAIDAIHTGDLPALKRLLAENPDLAQVRLGDNEPGGMSRTLLHVATDWPGHFPNGAATVAVLIEAGADIEVLLARGADLNWLPGWERLTPLDAARRNHFDELGEWLRGLGARSAEELG